MKSKNTLIGIALTITLLISTAAPALAAGGAEDGLSVAVDQGDDVVVTVERETVVDNNTTTVPVANATVTATALNNSTYADFSGTTDENGTVALPDPSENVTVVVTATWNNTTAETQADLVVANGTADEGTEREFANFGQRLSAFVHEMLNAGDVDGPLGQLVSTFARENNPGADHRNENAAKEKGHEKKEKRNEHAKNGKANGQEKKDGKAKENEGREKKDDKRNGHAKKDKGKRGGDAEETTEEETTVQDDETAETTDDTATAE